VSKYSKFLDAIHEIEKISLKANHMAEIETFNQKEENANQNSTEELENNFSIILGIEEARNRLKESIKELSSNDAEEAKFLSYAKYRGLI
jgi:aspartate oxidase